MLQMLRAFLATLCVWLAFSEAQGAEMSVVVSQEVPLSEISTANLQGIFSVRVRSWPNGQPVRVFVLPDRSEAHREFARQVLHVYPYVLRDAWDRLVFTGTGQAPIEVENENELLQKIASTPGSIGYVQKGRANEKVKTLVVR